MLRPLVTLLLLPLFLIGPLFAVDGLDLGGGVVLKWDEVNQVRNALTKTTEEKIFYHWTSTEIGFRWSEQGSINKGEVDFYNISTGDRQVHGAGIYLAELNDSSSKFGDFPVVFKIKKGTPVYDEDIIREITGKDLDKLQITELGKEINFIRNVRGDWWLTHHPVNTSNIEYAGAHGTHAKVIDKMKSASDLHRFLNSVKQSEASNWLRAFYNLTYYMDGISLFRAIHTSPANPWLEFEPENFKPFEDLRNEILQDKKFPKDDSSYKNWAYGSELDKEEWVQNQVDDELKYIYQRINSTGEYNFRGHSIRAGGTQPGQRFRATPAQLHHMLENPYLEVKHELAPDKKSFFVSYYYPGVKRWKQVRPFLSEKLVNELLGLSEGDLSSQKVSADYNQRILKELLDDLFRKLHGNEVKAGEFIQKFVSIHPFSNTNGRVGRVFIERELHKRGKSLAPMFLSDLDLLVSPRTFDKILEDSHQSYIKLYKAFALEFLMSNLQNRMPQYYQLKEWNTLFESLSIYHFDDKPIGREYFENIRERKFQPLFRSRQGDAWDYIPGKEGTQVSQLAKYLGASAYNDGIIEKAKLLIAELTPDNVNTSKLSLINYILNDIEELDRENTLLKDYTEKVLFLIEKTPQEKYKNRINFLKKLMGQLSRVENNKIINQILDTYNKDLSLDKGSEFFSFLEETKSEISSQDSLEQFIQNKINEDELLKSIQNMDPNLYWGFETLDKKLLRQVYQSVGYELKTLLIEKINWSLIKEREQAEIILDIIYSSLTGTSDEAVELRKEVMFKIHILVDIITSGEPQEGDLEFIKKVIQIFPNDLAHINKLVHRIGHEDFLNFILEHGEAAFLKHIKEADEDTLSAAKKYLSIVARSEYVFKRLTQDNIETFLSRLDAEGVEYIIGNMNQMQLEDPLSKAVLNMLKKGVLSGSTLGEVGYRVTALFENYDFNTSPKMFKEYLKYASYFPDDHAIEMYLSFVDEDDFVKTDAGKILKEKAKNLFIKIVNAATPGGDEIYYLDGHLQVFLQTEDMLNYFSQSEMKAIIIAFGDDKKDLLEMYLRSPFKEDEYRRLKAMILNELDISVQKEFKEELAFDLAEQVKYFQNLTDKEEKRKFSQFVIEEVTSDIDFPGLIFFETAHEIGLYNSVDSPYYKKYLEVAFSALKKEIVAGARTLSMMATSEETWKGLNYLDIAQEDRPLFKKWFEGLDDQDLIRATKENNLIQFDGLLTQILNQELLKRSDKVRLEVVKEYSITLTIQSLEVGDSDLTEKHLRTILSFLAENDKEEWFNYVQNEMRYYDNDSRKLVQRLVSKIKIEHDDCKGLAAGILTP
jgi:hypothetical protein